MFFFGLFAIKRKQPTLRACANHLMEGIISLWISVGLYWQLSLNESSRCFFIIFNFYLIYPGQSIISFLLPHWSKDNASPPHCALHNLILIASRECSKLKCCLVKKLHSSASLSLSLLVTFSLLFNVVMKLKFCRTSVFCIFKCWFEEITPEKSAHNRKPLYMLFLFNIIFDSIISYHYFCFILQAFLYFTFMVVIPVW